VLVYLQETHEHSVEISTRLWLPVSQCHLQDNVESLFLSFGIDSTVWETSERFKVNRLRDKEEIFLIDIHLSRRLTTWMMRKRLPQKWGQFQLTKIRFYFNGKKTIEYFTIFKWMKDGRTLDRTWGFYYNVQMSGEHVCWESYFSKHEFKRPNGKWMDLHTKSPPPVLQLKYKTQGFLVEYYYRLCIINNNALANIRQQV